VNISWEIDLDWTEADMSSAVRRRLAARRERLRRRSSIPSDEPMPSR
jgi:hypothetical protein